MSNYLLKMAFVGALILLYSNSSIAQNVTGDSSKTKFSYIQVLPRFPGGDQGLSDFLAKSVVYPKKALRKGVEGSVNVTFVVERDGSLSDIKALGNPDPILVKEAVRVMKSSPRWESGRQDNRPVRVQYTVPIVFKLQ